MRKLIYLSVVVLTIISCSGKSPVEQDKVVSLNRVSTRVVLGKPVAEKETQADEADRHAPAAAKAIDRKIIKEGDIIFETADITSTRDAIYKSLKKLGGYVAVENEANNNDNGRKELTLNVKIPASNFEVFLNNVSSQARVVDSKNIRVKDVTTEFIDISTQLANKKKLEDRYLELLKKGEKIADLLEIENKLTEIRSEIESTQGQLNYLTKQVEFSSLDITFYSRQLSKDTSPTFGFRLLSAFSGGWDILGSLFFGFISWWPIWIILTASLILIRTWRKKHPKKLLEKQ